MSEVRSTFRLRPGDAAPFFVLPDASDTPVSLAQVKDSAGLLVVFACNHCPFVVHLATALGSLAAELKKKEVGTVAITSNDLSAYPQDGPRYMPDFARRHGWEFPYLVDESQETAVAYGAACTPDFFLFNAAGALHYAGQFDSTRPGSREAPTGADLRDAARRMLAGEAPPEKTYPSSGCNIKWRPDKRPDWWNLGHR
jgi:peroxiredoxin